MSQQQKQSAFKREKQSEFKRNKQSSAQETKSSAAAGISSRRKTGTARTKKNASSSYRIIEHVSSLEELKELSSSWLDSIKRQTERSHSDILKEVEACNSLLYKHRKIQTQTQTQSGQKLMDNICKDFKKMMVESCEAVKGSYDEFQAEAQASHSGVCKTSTPEKTQH